MSNIVKQVHSSFLAYLFSPSNYYSGYSPFFFNVDIVTSAMPDQTEGVAYKKQQELKKSMILLVLPQELCLGSPYNFKLFRIYQVFVSVFTFSCR